MDRAIAQDYLKRLGLTDGQRASIRGSLVISHAQWFNQKLQNVGSGDIEPLQVSQIFEGLVEGELFIAALLSNKTVEDLFHHAGPSNSDLILIFRRGTEENLIYQVLPLHWDEYEGRTRETHGVIVTTLSYPSAVKLVTNNRP